MEAGSAHIAKDDNPVALHALAELAAAVKTLELEVQDFIEVVAEADGWRGGLRASTVAANRSLANDALSRANSIDLGRSFRGVCARIAAAQIAGADHDAVAALANDADIAMNNWQPHRETLVKLGSWLNPTV